MKQKNKAVATNLVLIAIVVALAVIPFIIAANGEFSGADNRATNAIAEINANYKPWFSFVWTPPSGEVETFLFSLQAGLGAGFVGYYIGYARGRKSKSEAEKS